MPSTKEEMLDYYRTMLKVSNSHSQGLRKKIKQLESEKN